MSRYKLIYSKRFKRYGVFDIKEDTHHAFISDCNYPKNAEIHS